MNANTSSDQPRKSNWPPRPRYSGGRRQRGATLVTAIFATFGLSLFIGSTVLYVSTTHSLAWSRANSESALLLAEGGINRELQFISKQMQTMKLPKGHVYQVRSGEPHPGEPMTIPNMPGKVWVYTSEPGSTNPWKGHGPAQINCTAEVGGARYGGQEAGPSVVRRLTIQTSPQSVFSAFAVFGLHSAGNGEQPAIGISGGSQLIVNGNVGTNGRVQGGAGEINFTRAYNYNANQHPGGQFTGKETYAFAPPLVMPTVTELLAGLAPTGHTSNPWNWLDNANDNDQIREFTTIGGSLTRSGTQRAGFSKDPLTLTNKFLGSWSGISFRPLTTKRTLIFPPGDYYLNGVDLDWDPTTEILIDNAGLTTPEGKNSARKPIRFWFYGGSGQDYVQIPIRMTNQEDQSTFRIFYGKDGAVLNLIRKPGFTEKDFVVSGCIYAVTSRLDPETKEPIDSSLKGTQIDFFGDSEGSGNNNVLYGSLIADRVTFHGMCQIIYPSYPMDQINDPLMGVAYSSNCVQEPCYAD